MIRKLTFGLKLVLPFAILAFLASRFELGRAVHAASAVPAVPLIVAIVALLLQPGVSSARLQVLLASFGLKLSFASSVRVTLEGMFFSQTFISFLGGDAVRMWRVRQRGLTFASSASVIALDRLIGLAAGHFCLVCSLPWLFRALPDVGARLILLTISIGGLAVLSIALLASCLCGRLGIFRRLPSWLKEFGPLTLLLEVATVGRHLFHHPGASAKAALLSFVIAMLNSATFGSLLFGMGIDGWTALKCALLLPAVLEIAMLPVSFAGWGVREGAAVVAFGALGVSPHISLAASVAFGLISMGVSTLGGAVWLQNRSQVTGGEGERSAAAEPVTAAEVHEVVPMSPQSTL